MAKWKVPMPKKPRADGKAHFVIAYKTAEGIRMEFDGALPQFIAERLMREACVNAKEPAQKEATNA